MKSAILLPLLLILAGFNSDGSFAQSQPSNQPVAQPSKQPEAQPSNQPVAQPSNQPAVDPKSTAEYWNNQFRDIREDYIYLKGCLEKLENREIEYGDIKACVAGPYRYIMAPPETAPIAFMPSPTAHSLVATPSGNQAASGSPTLDELQRENTFLKSKSYAAIEAYNQYYYDTHARKMAELRRDAFAWQAGASEILVWVVVMVCVSGIAFSGFQLWRATAPEINGSTAKPGGDPLATNVELSWQSVRVTSSVIGLVVLVISVVYLYLFLKDVYRIDVEEFVTSPPAQMSPQPR